MRNRFIHNLLLLLIVSLPATGLPAQQADDPPYFDAQRWEATIRAFEAQDAETYPPAQAIVFHGSSSIYFWHDRLAADMHPLTVIPRGFGGSTMMDALFYLERMVTPYQPRAVVLYEGDNDIGRFKLEPRRVRNLFLEYVEKLHQALPDTRVYLLAIKPSMLRWDDWPQMSEANRLLADICAQDDLLTFIDVATPLLNAEGMPDESLFVEDRLHLNRKGYERWRAVVRPILMEAELAHEATGNQD